MMIRILWFFALTSCAFSEDLPALGTTLRGMQRFGDYEVIYGAHEHRFLFGILIYRDPFTSLSTPSTLEHHGKLQLQSGITCEFITNEVAVTKTTKKVTTKLRPFTIYLLNQDLSMSSSADVSGIGLRPRRVWSRDAKQYVTVEDLVLPKDLLKRLGKDSF